MPIFIHKESRKKKIEEKEKEKLNCPNIPNKTKVVYEVEAEVWKKEKKIEPLRLETGNRCTSAAIDTIKKREDDPDSLYKRDE